MTVGERIQSLRKKAGWTQARLAAESGVAAISIHQYESNKRKPQLEQLQEIAKVLGVSVDYLITGGTHISQTHLGNGVHIYKNTSPFGVVADMLGDLSTNDFDILYQDEYLIIAVDKESTATEEDRQKLIELYRPTHTTGMSEEMRRITVALDQLNPTGQQEAVKRIEELTEIPKYQKDKEPPQPE